MVIYCCTCEKNVNARLTDGAEVYPHRQDLAKLPFWICNCGSFVGCHHKSANPTRPLGVIPSDEIKEYRKKIHAILDPIWKNGWRSRSWLYRELSQVLGRQYHTASLSNIQECVLILSHVVKTYEYLKERNK